MHCLQNVLRICVPFLQDIFLVTYTGNYDAIHFPKIAICLLYIVTPLIVRAKIKTYGTMSQWNLLRISKNLSLSPRPHKQSLKWYITVNDDTMRCKWREPNKKHYSSSAITRAEALRLPAISFRDTRFIYIGHKYGKDICCHLYACASIQRTAALQALLSSTPSSLLKFSFIIS